MASDTKVAFITGANRGIGFETARELGAKGIQVVIGSRDAEKGKAAAEKLRQISINADSIEFDVGDVSQYQQVYDYFDKRYGKLDILVNNAGVNLESSSNGNATSSTSSDLLRRTFDTNFFNVVALTQTLLPLLKKAPAARIVNPSSILGSLTLQADPQSPLGDAKPFAYDASKTALNAFTVHLAHELRGTHIKVNSAHPGWVKTEMGGSQAPLEVSEGGKTSVELALLPDDGPTGGYFHLGKALPW